MPQREGPPTDAAREIVAPVDADHPRRVTERGDLREQLRLYRLPRDEQLDGLDSRGGRRLDQILALRDKEAELVPPAPLRQLPNELEPLVLTGSNQASSAALACAAIAPKAAGSLTARSASTFRSSAMSALRQPATNWL